MRNRTISTGTINAGAVQFGDHGTAIGTFTMTQDAGSADPARAPSALVTVAADVEDAAVRAAVLAVNATPATPATIAGHKVAALGRVGKIDVFLLRTQAGTVRPGATTVLGPVVRELRPSYVVSTGICYGLRDDDPTMPQQPGDVVVADELRLIGHKRVTGDDATVSARGGRPHPSTALVEAIRACRPSWPNRAWVHYGPVVSESVLVDSPTYRADVRRREPEAIAGEMEGAGVYVAATEAKVDWGLVKAICDWGHGKTDDHQRLAAANAASLVVHMMASD